MSEEHPLRGGHPLQPIEIKDGIGRFKINNIVRFLLDAGPFDLNKLATMDFPAEDYEQLMMLIGYSVSGFNELSRVSDAACEEANAKVGELLRGQKC